MTNLFGFDPQLPEGAYLTFLPGVAHASAVTWERQKLTVVARADSCSITVPPGADVAALAAEAGRRLSHVSSLGLAVLLLYIAHHRAAPALPTCKDIDLLVYGFLMIRKVNISRSEPVVSDEVIAAFVQAEIAASERDEMRRLNVYEGPWNAARTLVAFGASAWRMRGEQAWRWFTQPLHINDVPVPQGVEGVPSLDNRFILWRSASTFPPSDLYDQLPVPYAAMRHPASVFVSWQSAAAGADHMTDLVRTILAYASPRSESAPHSVVDTLAHLKLPEDAKKPIPTLTESARRIVRDLLRTDRPYPRLLDRLLAVDIPTDAVPELADWFDRAQVRDIWIIPTPAGLWVSLRDHRPDRTWFWWQPSLEQADRMIVSANPRAWPATNLLLCTLWHDLCADAEVISEQQPPPATTDGKHRTKGRVVKSVVNLPPRIRVTTVSWSTPEERRAIRTTTRRGHAYRRLPDGWEALARDDAQQSKAGRAFQQRRGAAVARAEAHEALPPPRGYTYVRPYGVIDVVSPLAPRVRVRSRGLFTLALELPVIGQEIADAEDEAHA